MTLLSVDIGLSTGLALLTPHRDAVLTETVGAADLAFALEVLSLALRPHPVLLERPVLGFRSALSRNLAALCTDAERIFPDLVIVEAWQWKPQQKMLRRYAQAEMPEIWKATGSRHEKDALLLALWHLKVLRPAPKTC